MVGFDQKQGFPAEKPGFSGGEMLGHVAMGSKRQRLLREKGREMVQEYGFVPSSFLQIRMRLGTPMVRQ